MFIFKTSASVIIKQTQNEKAILMYSLNKIKLQYFGHLMRGAYVGKDPDAGKDWRRRRRGKWRMNWLDSITDAMGMIWANSGREWRRA